MYASVLKKAVELSPFEALPQKCDSCLWRQDGFKCDAFPEGVPPAIMLGVFDHSVHYEDEVCTDDGLTYSPA